MNGFQRVRKQALRRDTPGQGVVVDVGECAVERPKEKPRACYWRQEEAPPAKKPRGSWKAAPGASKAVRVGKGRRHDFHRFKQSRGRVHPSLPIHADSGCQGLQKLHANTHKPTRATKATKKRPLSPETKAR